VLRDKKAQMKGIDRIARGTHERAFVAVASGYGLHLVGGKIISIQNDWRRIASTRGSGENPDEM
jgi:hypothetical protein